MSNRKASSNKFQSEIETQAQHDPDQNISLRSSVEVIPEATVQRHINGVDMTVINEE